MQSLVPQNPQFHQNMVKISFTTHNNNSYVLFSRVCIYFCFYIDYGITEGLTVNPILGCDVSILFYRGTHGFKSVNEFLPNHMQYFNWSEYNIAHEVVIMLSKPTNQEKNVDVTMVSKADVFLCVMKC